VKAQKTAEQQAQADGDSGDTEGGSARRDPTSVSEKEAKETQAVGDDVVQPKEGGYREG